MFAEPTVVDNLVLIGSCSGNFYALDLADGHVVWSCDVSGDQGVQFHGNPLIIDSMVFFGTDNLGSSPGAMYALDWRTGDLLWKRPAARGIASDISTWHDSLVFAITMDDTVWALAASTGELRWSFRAGKRDDTEHDSLAHAARTATASSVLITEHGAFYIGRRDDILHNLDPPTGRELWNHPFDSHVIGGAAAFDSRLLVGMADSTLHFIDADSGLVIRTDPLPCQPGKGAPVDNRRLLFLSGRNGRNHCEVVCYDLAEGRVVWRRAPEDSTAQWYVPRVHIWGDNLVLGTSEGQVEGLSIADGSTVFSGSAPYSVRAIGRVDSTLLVGTRRGILYAWRVGDE
ncbi:MAG: PQQ-binding-like beta-propeller repeat protein [bacterium]